MLEELSKYENLGSPQFFTELFTLLNGTETPWKDEHVRGYFYNKIVGNSSVFDGCLPLAKSIGAVTIDSDGHILLNPSLIPALVSENYLSKMLLGMLIISLKDDDVFHEIFCSKHMSFDIIYKSIQIDGAAFRFRYANFRHLLLDLNFLQPHPDAHIKKYIINGKYKKLFDQEVMPEIKRRKLGIDQLELLLEKNRIQGEEAEKFVLAYERRRLAAHHQVGNINIISSYDVMAGYDVASYESIVSSEIDRFIEVKSFTSFSSFHWSRNEIDVARLRRDKYFLYLVDRNMTKDLNYEPMMIRDPYVTIMKNDEWLKVADSFSISKQ